ncbi:glycoside hydrolase family 6 protein [Jidongwangia harbinensis]|uniref:glycoside hydrolase family 6 protein n=1 Tax=Jidongwangia harbinensis TaxID=2878561 RepID=UPI001CD94513|nr:glycoside hydrolase family 6 protein [Jidongwangia harbinensis]MCA2216626.1 glycoside hydrolase family 6 protein [Jidongwangia harbinensis]
MVMPRLSTALLAAAVMVAASAPAPANARSGGQPSPRATERAENPYAGAAGYRNADWAARVMETAAGTADPVAAARMTAVADQPTAVWLRSISEVGGLRRHLDAAVAQQSREGRPVVLTLVLHNLPNRECGRRAGSELRITDDGLARYRTEYVDPIAATLAAPEYAGLRIAAVVEPESISRLIRFTGPFPDAHQDCEEAERTGAYADGIAYALERLQAVRTVYTYLDIGSAATLGWEVTQIELLDRLVAIAARTPAGLGGVDGFASNVADYVPDDEPFIDLTATIAGASLRWTRFYDWTLYADETDYTTAIRAALVARGFDERVGILTDTSRNGWGGPARPTAPSRSTSVDTYANESRMDRRLTRSYHWCNQAGAGLGARPAAGTVPGLHAYAWIKPPGESDGWGEVPAGAPRPEHYEQYCDPNTSVPCCRGSAWRSNALPGAPPAGGWHREQFVQLVANAYPPVASPPAGSPGAGKRGR